MSNIKKGMLVNAHCDRMGQTREYIVNSITGNVVTMTDNQGQKVIATVRSQGVLLFLSDKDYK